MLRLLRPSLNSFFFKRTLSHLANLKSTATEKMKRQYPHILSKHFQGEIAYVLRGEAPDEMKAMGGFLPRHKELWFSNTGNGNNTGSVCFSLLPEVTALFSPAAFSHKDKAYLYAFPLQGEFLLPGGPWRQVISPGGFPLPAHWRCRQVKHTDMLGLLHLGPTIGEGEFPQRGNIRLKEYLNENLNTLHVPKDIAFGGDVEAEYDVKDTKETAQFQKMVEDHYECVMRGVGLKKGPGK